MWTLKEKEKMLTYHNLQFEFFLMAHVLGVN